jgi:hypothetical protein
VFAQIRASAGAAEIIWRAKGCDCRMNRHILGLVSSGLGRTAWLSHGWLASPRLFLHPTTMVVIA